MKRIKKYIYTLFARIFPHVTVMTKYGFRMRLATSGKVIEKNIIIKKYREKENSDCMLQLINNGDVFVDIGANIGWYTLLVASRLQNSGHVFAFEPAKRNFQYLEQNRALNHLKNVTLFKKAVGAHTDVIDLNVNSEDPGKTSFLDNYQAQTTSEQVEVIVLDDFLPAHQSIDHVKIDVEGYEYEVLKGMKRLLIENEAITIFFEYSPVFYDTLDTHTSKDILTFLEELGFIFYVIENDSLKKLGTGDEIYRYVMEYKDGQCDLIASRVAGLQLIGSTKTEKDDSHNSSS